MKTGKQKSEIDWEALDKSWADQYEEDYGNHFQNLQQ